MRVLSVQLRDFRTYARAEAALGPGLTVVHGPNGAGKSNLLEALYFGCTGPLAAHAQRARAGALRRAGRARGRARQRGQPQEHELSVGYGAGPAGERGDQAHDRRRRARRAPARRRLPPAARACSSPTASSCSRARRPSAAPTSIRSSRPSGRCAPSDRREYSRVLAQRNALLGAHPLRHALRDATLADVGRASWPRRALAVREHRAAPSPCSPSRSPRAPTQLGLSGDGELEYRPRTRAADDEELVAELQCAPGRRDLERGFSGHGPHRDELAILRDAPRAAPLRLAGRAAAGPAGAAARRARRARPRATRARR